MFLQKQISKFFGCMRILRVSLFLILLVVSTGVFSYTRVATPSQVYAATSSNLNFQARLLNSAGNVVPDGFYNIDFKLYNHATSGTQAQGTCSGNCLWEETYYDSNGVTAGNDNRLRVVNGYFSVNLGSQTSFPSTINWEQDIWLSMNVGGSTQTATPTFDGEMTPRIKLTAVPYAQSAGQLSKNQGTYTGTVDFGTLTADRKYLLPDSTLATTASPGTICIFNGAVSNCPAATGSAFYIQNTGGSGTPQAAANFNIQATDSTTVGTIGGIIRGAAGGQTADLFQLQSSAGVILTAFQADGKLVFGPSGSQDTNLYRSAADTLKTDDALNIGSTITTGDALTVTNNSSSGNIAVFNDGATPVLTLADGGSLSVTPSVAAATIAFGTAAQTGTITLGQSTAGQIINIGGAQVATGNTQTIHIGDSATGTGKDNITIGNTNGASTAIIQGGTGTGTGDIVLQTAAAGIINVGNNAVANTVNIANTSGANNTTVGIASGVTGGSNTATVTVGSANAANSTLLLQGGNVNTAGSEAIRLQTAAAGGIAIGTAAQTGTITLGQATTATTQIVNIESANGTSSTQTINIGGGTSTTSGGKVVNIANGTPGASTTNTVAIGTGGTTTGTVGITIGSNTAANHYNS